MRFLRKTWKYLYQQAESTVSDGGSMSKGAFIRACVSLWATVNGAIAFGIFYALSFKSGSDVTSVEKLVFGIIVLIISALFIRSMLHIIGYMRKDSNNKSKVIDEFPPCYYEWYLSGLITGAVSGPILAVVAIFLVIFDERL